MQAATLFRDTYELPRLMTEHERKISRSSYRCPSCELPPNRTEQQLLADSASVFCRGCHRSYTCVDATVLVGYGSQKFFWIEQVRSSVWWHATLQRDWPAQPLADENEPRVHIGTYPAAMIRASSFELGQVYLHRVVLDDEATISKFFLFDTSDWGGRPDADDAYRYVNRWESPGSISLLVKPQFLQVTSSRPLVR